MAATLHREALTRLADVRERLERLKDRLEEARRRLLDELNKWLIDIKRSPFIGGNTMRRDVTADYVAQYHQLHGRSSIVGAMAWMFGLSFLLTFVLGWIPIVGPFIGPVAGGYMGGRRAGSIGRALLAAILPAVLLSLFILGLGAIAAALVDRPVVGAIAAIIAGALWVILIIHNLLLFLSALIGGLVRQMEGE